MTNQTDISSKKTASLRDWTKGSIFKNLLSLSWPVMVGGILNNIGPTIDLIWVGKLGAASVAGVGVAGTLVQLLDALKMGLDTGTRALVARLVGAGDLRQANHIALQGYVVTIAFAAIVGTAGAIFAGPILHVMGLAPDVVAQGTPYLRIQFIGILTMGLVRQNEGVMLSSGDTINPMKVSVIYRHLPSFPRCPLSLPCLWLVDIPPSGNYRRRPYRHHFRLPGGNYRAGDYP